MRIEQLHPRTHNSVLVYQPSVSNAQCKIGTQNHSDAGMICDFEHQKTAQHIARSCLALDICQKINFFNHKIDRKTLSLLK